MGAWIDTQQAVEYAGTDHNGNPIISARTLNKQCRRREAGKGGIEHGRNGRKYVFKPAFIDDYLLINGRKS